ncbi:MAG: histidinol dehydrogenase [Rhodospirillaceae bacterium]|nr:histidinol dehydrogenase [Rhodospirillaceae bacterium]MBT7731587.1 histidinol dehydrogenase [Rhodospirillaceae bacterium]
MPLKLFFSDDNYAAKLALILDKARSQEHDVTETVIKIINDVRLNGDEALIALTKKFDSIDLMETGFQVTQNEINIAKSEVSEGELAALKLAADRIELFHAKQKPQDISYVDGQGVGLGLRWNALTSVGLYVPGGKASYPSSVLMNAIPAKVAGVRRRVMTVPSLNGSLNPLVLAAADLAGVTEIYRIGGAQAVAALAYGTGSIAPVDKIVGPGNAYVATAKKIVYGQVGIDSIAGPSEIVIVADKENNPEWIAYDLLAQAEHDTAAQSILITDDKDFSDQVILAVDSILNSLPRAEIARKSWDKHGAVIILESLDDAPRLIDTLAPEHLELAIDDPAKLVDRISHAGAIFLGRYTPEAAGDYVAGPNHVLPTNRSARFSSGLSVFDFLKRTTLVDCNKKSLELIGPAAITLANAEGLDAHAKSIAIRIKQNK